MKRLLCVILAILMILSLAACGSQNSGGSNSGSSGSGSSGGEAQPSDDEDFEWTREGYFTDAEDHYLTVMATENQGEPGWYVSVYFDENNYGYNWNIPQEGKTLHGTLETDNPDAEAPVVTISEEGEDGLLLEMETGETYHFALMEMEEASVIAYINTDGFGQIAYAPEGEPLEFDDEFPSQSAYIGIAEPATYVFGAKADEGWHFIKWTKDGEEYSRDEQITVELTDPNTEFIAVFYPEGKDDTPIDLDSVTTMGELLSHQDLGTSTQEDAYVYVFEQDGIYYRAIADLTKEQSDAIFALDFDDPDYDAKVSEIISPLPISRIENLSETVLTEEEMAALIGKTGEELFNDGWTNYGWNLQDMIFYMSYGAFDYDVVFEGEVKDYDAFDEEDINPLVVKSVTLNGIGNATNLD